MGGLLRHSVAAKPNLIYAALAAVPLWINIPAHAQFATVVEGSNVYIAGYSGPGGDVVVPETIDGMPVTGIAARAFENQTTITSITLPDVLISIGIEAFYGCTSLTSLDLPARAFFIGSQSFVGCDNLSAINIDDASLAYRSIDGVVFDKPGEALVVYPPGKSGHYVVPSGTTTIREYAISNSPGLTSTEIPSSVTSIAVGNFSRCPSLLMIDVTEGNSAFKSVEGILFTKDGTVLSAYPAAKLGAYVVPDGVRAIGSEAFIECSGLSSVRIPASVANIYLRAFAECPELSEVFFEGDVPVRSDDVLQGSENATVFYLPSATGWGESYAGRPTVLWDPEIATETVVADVDLGELRFDVAANFDFSVAIEGADDASPSDWARLGTVEVIEGTASFVDDDFVTMGNRFYRLRMP